MGPNPTKPTIFGREPIAWIGIILVFVITIIQTALGQGLISDALAGQVTNGANSLAETLIAFLPLILNIYGRSKVTPVAAPVLPLGAPVTPEGYPDGAPAAAVLPVYPPATVDPGALPPVDGGG